MKKYEPMVFPDSDEESTAKSDAQEARESGLPKASLNILTIERNLGAITLSSTADVEVKLRNGDKSLKTLAKILQVNDDFQSIGYDCVQHKIFENDMDADMAGWICGGLFQDHFKVVFEGFDGDLQPMQRVYGLWESGRGEFATLLEVAATYH